MEVEIHPHSYAVMKKLIGGQVQKVAGPDAEGVFRRSWKGAPLGLHQDQADLSEGIHSSTSKDNSGDTVSITNWYETTSFEAANRAEKRPKKKDTHDANPNDPVRP